MTDRTTDGAYARGGDGRFTRTVETAERDAEAARLRSRSQSYRAIARQMSYASPASAHAAVARGLAAVVAEPAAEAREHMLAQLDYLAEKALEVLETRHIVVQHGKVVTLAGDDGKATPITDDGPVLDAVQALLKVQERRAKLLGLDAPKRLEVVTLDWIDAQLAQLSAEVDQAAGQLERADADEAAAASGVTHS